MGTALSVDRIRPNLLVEPAGDDPFPENAWIGHTIQIGELEMRIDERDGRCLVVTLDPETGERNPAIRREIAQTRDRCLGVYGSVVKPGKVRVGDEVRLLD